MRYRVFYYWVPYMRNYTYSAPAGMGMGAEIQLLGERERRSLLNVIELGTRVAAALR